MARYDLLIKRSAVRELEAVSTQKLRRLIVRRIRALQANPRPPGCEKLTGRGRYRVRQGPYRIVYSVDDTTLDVTVFKIGQRKDVYR
ncbi:MAG: type II toxin-antitoxin system RelE/ParE family toxin [Candidatus Eisenbacteria bacterium]